MTTELDELIQYWKDYAAVIRITYPGLYQLVLMTVNGLEEYRRLKVSGITKVEVSK